MPQLFPVAELKNRYHISKQAEITRRQHLGIKPIKIDGKSYVTEDELALLDQLDHHLKNSGKMSDFKATEGSLPTRLDQQDSTRLDSVDQPDYQEATLAPETDWESLLLTVVEKLQPPQSPIANWEDLQKASDNGWLVTTKQVQALVGTKPKGERWQRGSFLFIRQGKIGRQAAWRVEKAE